MILVLKLKKWQATDHHWAFFSFIAFFRLRQQAQEQSTASLAVTQPFSVPVATRLCRASDCCLA